MLRKKFFDSDSNSDTGSAIGSAIGSATDSATGSLNGSATHSAISSATGSATNIQLGAHLKNIQHVSQYTFEPVTQFLAQITKWLKSPPNGSSLSQENKNIRLSFEIAKI